MVETRLPAEVSSIEGLIFPSAASSIHSQVRDIRRHGLSISNRLKSIKHDSDFVREMAAEYSLPILANERCGSWYIPPELKAGSAYFKSTDGHHGQWSFSFRRLNLHILRQIGEEHGTIIVDSTRRGKHMPDALSKTVPIWCAVMNCLLFPERTETHAVVRLEELISESEHSQMSQRLPHFVETAEKLDLDLHGLRDQVQRPIRVKWISRSLNLPKPAAEESCLASNTLYLCMSSGYQSSAFDESISGYVQGAGDDNENWAHGLTPELYWKNQTLLLKTPESELPSMIESLIVDRDLKHISIGDDRVLIRPTAALKIGRLTTESPGPVIDELIIYSPALLPEHSQKLLSKRALCLCCESGKRGSRALRKELGKIPVFIEQNVLAKTVTVLCRDGKDISVGVALVLLCLYTSDDGSLHLNHVNADIDKDFIRKKLSWIMSSSEDAKPSRATLNSVNSFLMKPD